MRRLVLLILPVCLLLFTGCGGGFTQYAREIGDLDFLTAVGFDAETREEIEVTASSRRSSSGKGESADVRLLSGKGATISFALAEMQTDTDKHLFMGHVSHYVIGEGMAGQGLQGILDYIARDYETRLDARLVVVRGGDAKGILEKSDSPENYISDRLLSLEKNSPMLSVSSQITVSEALSALKENGVVLLPAIAPKEESQNGEGGKEEQKPGNLFDILTRQSEESSGGEDEKDKKKDAGVVFELCGYAVLKDAKLVGFLDEEESRGVCYLRNSLSSDVLQVRLPDETPVSLKLTSAHTEVVPSFDADDQLQSIQLRVSISSNLSETHTRGSAVSPEALSRLKEGQSALVKERIERVVGTARQMGCDFLGIGNEIRKKHPVKWEKNNFSERFASLLIEIVVVSEINRAYELEEPLLTA